MSHEPLPSAMAMVVAGDQRPHVRNLAKRQRERLSFGAFNDQILAAVITEYGGDESVARRYWELGRTTLAITRGPDRAVTVAEVMAFLREHHPPEADEADDS
jgi:hypothetical protein